MKKIKVIDELKVNDKNESYYWSNCNMLFHWRKKCVNSCQLHEYSFFWISEMYEMCIKIKYSW